MHIFSSYDKILGKTNFHAREILRSGWKVEGGEEEEKKGEKGDKGLVQAPRPNAGRAENKFWGWKAEGVEKEEEKKKKKVGENNGQLRFVHHGLRTQARLIIFFYGVR